MASATTRSPPYESLTEIEKAIGRYRGLGASQPEGRYEIESEFRVYPQSAANCGQNLPHGTDLDNLLPFSP